ncbi:MAG TPA: hypothetical protein VEK57_11820 [Thermoanaerobaculia bacterium]|nr:hypothetical protein [Thermoanaerobaculia bacterium]
MSNKVIKPPDADAAEPTTVEPAAPQPNIFTADAQERMARLRDMGVDFPDEAEPVALTRADKILAGRTPVAALEKAAVFAEAAPEVVAVFANDLPVLREAIAFELAYNGVSEEAHAFARRVDLAIYRKKLKAVTIARAIFRFGKVYMTIDAGDPMKTHIDDLRHALRTMRARRKKLAPPAPKQIEGTTETK